MPTKLFGLVTKLLIISPLVLVLPLYALADLYECKNEEGIVTHHSRVPCPEGYSSKLIQDERSSNTAPKPYTDKNVISKDENVEVISRGRLIDLIDHLEYGKYTVFMFYADWCAPCKTVKPGLEKYARSQNKFALKELDVLNWENPLVGYYNLAGLPYFIVYGPEGEFVERGPVLSKELKNKITDTN